MFPNDELDRANKYGEIGGHLHRTRNVLKCVYDFSKSGGALGDIALLTDRGAAANLPKNAIIRRVMAYVVTGVTSAGSATLALKIVNSADLMAATAKATLVANAFVDGVPVSTAATAVGPLAALAQVKATVGTAALTAGKVQFFIEYDIAG